ESAAGAGAAFFFALPAAEPDAAAPAAHPGGERSPAEPARAAILVADDNPDAREILRARLGAAGYRVLEAANGQEALAAMREHRPALALLDLMMPRLDGFAVLRQVREDPAISATPVIVLTAQVLGAAELARFGRRMPTVLEKGVFRTEEVLAHVEAALAGQQTPAGPARRIVRDAMACIHRRYAGRLTREDIAAEAAVGPRHLTRAFQQELGMSPMTYLLRYRINQARLLLAGQDISVAEVARAVGFGSEAHFNRSFRREAGVSPGAYRRGARAERRPAGPNPA
ncbi:MAG TPA: DNA-binding response regulator, partial [Herpetosiphonaceae bacterium]|nr:DNA-binding response regulator [Herpetosiphonaceae bacterium]